MTRQVTAAEARRHLRLLLPEFVAVIEEYRTVWGDPLRPNEIPPTYGEDILTIASPMLVSYAEAIRHEGIDTLDDDEVLAVHAVVRPVVDYRRVRRALFERNGGR